MQTFLFPILAFTALLCLPQCAALLPESSPITEGKRPQPPPPPPERTIFLWVSTSCTIQGHIGPPIPFGLPCPGAMAGVDGKPAANSVCAAAYPMSSLSDDERANIEDRITSNLIHQAVISANTSAADPPDARDIIPSGADREERPVRRPDDDGTLIANNWNDLFDANLDAINSVNDIPPADPGGTYRTGIGYLSGANSRFTGDSDNCNRWRDGTSSRDGIRGFSDQIDYERFHSLLTESCAGFLPLLCASFEGP